MNIEWIAGGIPTGELLQARVETKLGKLENRLGTKLAARVRLGSAGAHQFNCAVQFSFQGQSFTGSGEGADLLRAADDAIAKLERQLDRTLSRARATGTITAEPAAISG